MNIPKNWCIRGCREFEKWCSTVELCNIAGDHNKCYYYPVKFPVNWMHEGELPTGFTEIYFDDFCKHILKKETIKEYLIYN